MVFRKNFCGRNDTFLTHSLTATSEAGIFPQPKFVSKCGFFGFSGNQPWLRLAGTRELKKPAKFTPQVQTDELAPRKFWLLKSEG
jgi:hypothetical protein